VKVREGSVKVSAKAKLLISCREKVSKSPQSVKVREGSVKVSVKANKSASEIRKPFQQPSYIETVRLMALVFC
jgi:hypothetical protein